MLLCKASHYFPSFNDLSIRDGFGIAKLLSKLKRAQLGRALDFQNFELAQLGRALDLENFELLSETEIAPEREGFGFAKLRIPFQT